MNLLPFAQFQHVTHRHSAVFHSCVSVFLIKHILSEHLAVSLLINYLVCMDVTLLCCDSDPSTVAKCLADY